MNIFSFKQKKSDVVLDHWISFAEGFSYPSAKFYEAVEKDMAALEVPSMEISRVEFAEGGPLSPKRVYLRMIRERLVFDACAAPFGTGYFFSCRAVYVPPEIRLWHIVVVYVCLSAIYAALARFLGPKLALVALAGLVLAIAQIFRNAIVLRIADLDSTLLKLPVIGPFYERWFRKETYYRYDTRLLYLSTVPNIIQRLANEITAAHGIKLMREYRQSPILGDLYKPRAPRSDEPPSPVAKT